LRYNLTASFGAHRGCSGPLADPNMETDIMITQKIEWGTSYDAALEEAGRTGRLVLVDFFNPN
jgi:hypothetical protein